EFAFDESGRWLAWIVRGGRNSGNGVYLLNTNTGRVISLETDNAAYSMITWSKNGNALALIKELDPQNGSYAVLGFTNLSAEQPSKIVYDPGSDPAFPAEMRISEQGPPRWMDDLSGISFEITYKRAFDDRTGKPSSSEREDGEKDVAAS